MGYFATFADPIPHALALLRAAFPSYTFGAADPDPSVEGRPPLPYGMVRVDFSYGQPQGRPVLRIANLRVVAWGASEEEAFQLVQQFEAVLLGFNGDSQVQSYTEISGPLPYANDGNPICVVTVAARLRPITP